MKRIALLAAFAFIPVHPAAAAGIIRIANGDCAGLSAAASTPSGSEPSVILLARGGRYGACFLNVSGNIVIEGAGAQMQLLPGTTQITIASKASLTLRDLNFTGTLQPATAAAVRGSIPQPNFIYIVPTSITNGGYLLLDSVSISGIAFYSSVSGGGGILSSAGHTDLDNVSIVDDDFGLGGYELFDGDIAISQSTIANNNGTYAVFRNGPIVVANTIVATTNGSSICTIGFGANVASQGGNIASDASCGFNGQNDRVVGDAGLGDFGTHGGVVGNLALDNNSPAIGNGLAANCNATDARGVARGAASCDAGAYEFGGGQGNLAAAGSSGVYYQRGASNGHFVSILRLGADYVLVMWSTFDQKGSPAWLYGVGTLSGTTITVPQVAENLGGILHPGGTVTGATATLWGSMTLNLSSCNAAQLDYKSALPLFGSGSINLQRLVFIDGLDCSQ